MPRRAAARRIAGQRMPSSELAHDAAGVVGHEVVSRMVRGVVAGAVPEPEGHIVARQEQQQDTEERFVRSEDPSLTPEAARLLARELREVVGPERDRAPTGQAGSAGRAHATRGPLVSTLVANRQILLITLLLAIAVGGVLTLVTDSWWALVGALAVHAAATLVAAGSAIRLTTQTEHVAPDVAARLEDEGVGNPDQVLTELVEDLKGAGHDARGTTQVVTDGHNEQTAPPTDDPARAAVEQRTAMTPSSTPSEPAPSQPGTDDAASPTTRLVALLVVVVVGVVAFMVLMGVLMDVL